LETYTTDGVYTATYTGDIVTINIGAASDTSFNADYDFISLRKQGDPGPYDTLTDDEGNVLVDENGDELVVYY
jgi:hypothetical protein